MKKIIEYIFHEAPPIPNLIGDDHASMVLNLYSDFGIFFFFLLFALMCFLYGKLSAPKEAYVQRRLITYLVGTSMLCCALSRGLNVLAFWHNYYFINGCIKTIGTFVAFVTIIYVPFVIKAIKNIRELQEVKVTMEETSKKVDELKDISIKVLKKGTNND